MVNLGASREAFLDADKVVASFGLRPGQKVADLGCGSGFFSVAMAHVVGKDGLVTAVDVMTEPLESVQAHTQGLSNVRAVRADLEVLGGTKLADASQDLALLKNILFQSKQQDAIIREAVRITKTGGRVIMIDWKKGAGGFGPPDALRADPVRVRRLAEVAGLRLDHELAVDSFHFALVFMK